MKTLNHLALCAVALLSCANIAFAQETNSDATIITNGIALEVAQTNDTSTAPDHSEPVNQRGPIVAIGKNAESQPGQSTEAVVAIGGSAKANDDVQDAVVAIFGDAYAKGRVGDAVVAIFGNAHAEDHVGDAVVAVFGNVTLGSNAVASEAVAIGGTVTLAKGAKVSGSIQEIPFNIPGLPHIQELPLWIRECVFKLRLLSLHVVWPWIVAGVFFLIYALIAIAFPKPVAASLDEITRRPATTFFVGLLTKILVPLLSLVLILTGVGVLVLPFLFAALFFAGIIGKVAMLQYLGGALARAFGVGGATKNLLALLIGSAILLLLYLIPIVGFLAFAIFGMWAVGAAVTATFSNMSREKPQPPKISMPGGPSGNAPAGIGMTPPPFAGQASATNVAPAVIYPRAGFWERMGAAFLDLALLSIPFALLGPFVIPVGIAYFAGMWTWKGTTIGGLVLRQQVVRQNGEPITFVVALVRCLAAAFSAFVFFLGFFWIGWSREKQGWHDLIAGTHVVRLPHAISLVCL